MADGCPLSLRNTVPFLARDDRVGGPFGIVLDATGLIRHAARIPVALRQRRDVLRRFVGDSRHLILVDDQTRASLAGGPQGLLHHIGYVAGGDAAAPVDVEPPEAFHLFRRSSSPPREYGPKRRQAHGRHSRRKEKQVSPPYRKSKSETRKSLPSCRSP